ncbi:MAG: SusC/RagA family TonB-linked outer membrane protein, partial [Massilibacteroides sp.]|nr:SusC/RagA family TonB-linked outer membrane protein [Massilibacteroides sp.]
MKLFFLFILMTVGIASAEPLLAQEAKVSLRMENQRLEDVLKAVEKQTDLVFIYDSNIIDVDHKVSVNTQGENVYELLNSVFAQNEVAYTVINNKVVLSKATKAQQEGTTIKGTILDVTGLPIIGANVTIKGTTIGTITDLDGNFSLQIPQNAILTISYIGYKPMEVNTQGKKTFNLVLKEDAEALEEVVVIGYGVQKKADLTGAVASVKAKDLNVESNTNIMRALQGKMSGVEIVSNGGEPGNGNSVMIRGVGTFNNNAPLYIVDGMYMDGIDFINPNDIESIDVLKDASSAAIYGSRAANGVIIVTTKSGSNTSGVPTITASANLGFQNASKKIDVLNASQWSQITTESRQAAGLDALPLALNPEADNDFQDLMMQTGLMQTYNVSAKGGSQNFKYYVGGGYTNQDGIISQTGYERLNLQVKTEFKKGILTVGENVLISFERQKPSTRNVSRKGGIVGSMLNSIPAYNIYDENQDGGYNGPTGDALTWANPVAIMDMTAKRNEYSKTYVNTYAELELPYNLKYKLNVNTDLKNDYGMDFVPHYSMGLNSNDRNMLSETRGNNKNLLIENLLTFDKTFGDHKLTALAGYTFQYNKYRTMGVNSSNMPDGLYVADAATETLGTGSLIKNSLNSVLARIFYSYKNRYLLTATYRRDGSSKFMEDNQHGDFPSMSLGWNIKEENFMQKFDFLDMMKLRAGYGVLGNQEVGNYLYSSTVSSSINYLKNGNEMWNGAFPKTFASPSIKWEETKMT